MQRYYESKEIAKAYAYRPTYPPEVADVVLQYHGKNSKIAEKLDLMVDVGCGNGLSCNLFQKYFKKIIGFDVSEEQLKNARSQNEFDNITYEIGRAEDIAVPDASVDLLTAGIAAHWFDLPKFFKEVERVLKPTGCIALYGYQVSKIGSLLEKDEDLIAETGKVFQQMIYLGMPDDDAEKISSMEVGMRYPNIFKSIPFPNKERNDDIHVILDCSLNDIRGMMRSINCHETFMERKLKELKEANLDISQVDPTTYNLALKFVEKLKELWQIDDIADQSDQKVLKIDLHYFVLLARL